MVTVIINEVQLHWVTAACSVSPCRVSTPSNRRHIHFIGAVVPFHSGGSILLADPFRGDRYEVGPDLL